MQKGDNFIRYSKHGAVKGVVERVLTKKSYDLQNKVEIVKVMIKSTEGVIYDANECYKIEKELTLNFCQKIKALLIRAKNRK